MLAMLVADKVPAFNMPTALPSNDLGWGTAAFHQMGRKKVVNLCVIIRIQHSNVRVQQSH
jgi:hypothetical protein